MMGLADIVKQIESAGDPRAWRFERAAFRGDARNDSAVRVARICRCSLDTAKVILCSSWGAWQLMGFNLYDPAGFNWLKHVFDYLADEAAQRASFEDFCRRHDVVLSDDDMNDDAKLLAFARVYNGPANADAYVARLKAAMA